MKDQFLYSLRRQPAADFTRKVYQDIARLPGGEPLSQDVSSRLPRSGTPLRAPRRRVLALATLATLLLFVVTTLTSPQVRAIVEDIVRHVGELTLRETALYPFSDESPLLEPSDHLTLQEARQAVAFDFALPALLPDRYAMLDEVIVTPGFNSVLVRWRGQETRGDGLALRVSPAQPDVQYVVGSGSLQEIKINGEKAVFIRGGWLENNRSWDPHISRDVRWSQNGLTYQLSTGGQFSCPDEPQKRCPLSDEELIRIAASVP